MNRTLDFSIGEAHIIRDKFFDVFNISNFDCGISKEVCTYPPYAGNSQLIKLLEDKHQAPIIITNGAKQGLAASFYLLKKLGKSKLGMRIPFWSCIKPLAEMHGLKCSNTGSDCFLSVMPNNPDGYVYPDYDTLKYLADCHKDIGVPFVHDASFFSHTYLPDSYKLGAFGDLQIYSFSKLYGLSGLRLGYIVVHNKDYYTTLKEYIEMTTVGVSNLSQLFAVDMLSAIQARPDLERKFVVESRDALYKSKFLIKLLNRNVIGVPDDVEHIPGMFLWAKIKDFSMLEKRGVLAQDGKNFGTPGYVRMNIAVSEYDILELIERFR